MTHGQSSSAGAPGPVDRLRIRLSDPGPIDLAEPILARDLDELGRRLARIRRRGGAYATVDLSDPIARLLARLEAGRDLSREVH